MTAKKMIPAKLKDIGLYWSYEQVDLVCHHRGCGLILPIASDLLLVEVLEPEQWAHEHEATE